MRKAEGVLTLISETGQVSSKTFTCLHCSAIRPVQEDTRFWCSCCDGPVCNDRACRGECTPFKRKLDLAEARDRARRSYGLVG